MQWLADLLIRLAAVTLWDVLDVLLVAGLVYALLYAVRGTRAVQLLRGVLLLAPVVYLLLTQANLLASRWILQTILPSVFFIIPVVFQPELRRALERLGRAGRFVRSSDDATVAARVVASIALAADSLARRGHGALIVIERETGLDDLIERGLSLDALLTTDVLLQIFYPNTPLHDGAVVVRSERVAAARVVIPLGDVAGADLDLGTRHLAAIAATTGSDALAVVVSEETSIISLARDGRLFRHLDQASLGGLLEGYLLQSEGPRRPIELARDAAADVVATLMGHRDEVAAPQHTTRPHPKRPVIALDENDESELSQPPVAATRRGQ